MLPLPVADVAPDTHAFNPLRENLGMLAMAVIVLVFWLLYRKMIELTKRREALFAPWRDQLRSLGVSQEFVDALERWRLVHAEDPWPWLKLRLLGSDNHTFFSTDPGPLKQKLAADELVPVFVDGDNQSRVFWLKDGKGSRFVRVSLDGAPLGEFASFTAVMESLLEKVWKFDGDEVAVRRLAEFSGYQGVETLLGRWKAAKA